MDTFVIETKSGGRGGMPEREDRSKLQLPDDDADAIALYESMSSEELDAELAMAGIDPEPTIKAVKKLIREKLNS